MEQITDLYSVAIDTPIGKLMAVATESGLSALEFIDENKSLSNFLKSKYRILDSGNSITDQTKKELQEYFEKKRITFSIPLDFIGTNFQKAVWKSLLQIKFGKTSSYEEQARLLGNPLAIRAMAHANGLNKIAIIVPCHRVIGKNGSMTGYAGGIWRKEWLLDHEGSVRRTLKLAF
jgi:AraC family transcriptional regulator of adaptative response/methylated-DNA-[protein]-cysteine methyltransferase